MAKGIDRLWVAVFRNVILKGFSKAEGIEEKACPARATIVRPGLTRVPSRGSWMVGGNTWLLSHAVHTSLYLAITIYGNAPKSMWLVCSHDATMLLT